MIRKGMWCVDEDGRVGIAAEISALGEAEFHLVDEEGATTLVVTVSASSLVQARYREIPEPRRAIGRHAFAALGYE